MFERRDNADRNAIGNTALASETTTATDYL
jgi:hypothetical protein